MTWLHPTAPLWRATVSKLSSLDADGTQGKGSVARQSRRVKEQVLLSLIFFSVLD